MSTPQKLALCISTLNVVIRQLGYIPGMRSFATSLTEVVGVLEDLSPYAVEHLKDEAAA